MKKSIIIDLVIIMLIVNMTQFTIYGNAFEIDRNIICISEINEEKIEMNNFKENIDLLNSTFLIRNEDEFGIWIHIMYNGLYDEKKLNIDLNTFKLMLDGGGWKHYNLTMENTDDTTVGLQFVRTKIYLETEDIFVDVIQTKFTFETTCDTTEKFEVSLELRFPFSLLKSKVKSYNYILNFLDNLKRNMDYNYLINRNEYNPSRIFEFLYEKIINLIQRDSETYQYPLYSSSESYFCARVGFFSPEEDEGPNRIETRFFFGRNSIWDPRVFRIKIKPYDLEREYQLIYNNSYLTVDQSGNEAFNRVFSVNFEPAAELQITSIPGNGKISYNFGSSTGVATKISYSEIGGLLSGVIQSFIIDPLPEYMSFDLTMLGERSFRYESDTRYSVTYVMDSIDEGNLVKLELENLPETIIAEWGLKVYLLSLSGSGFVDLEMSSDVGRMSLSLYDSETPFIEINNFPQKLRVDGFIDVPNLQGSITTSKYSGETTTINIPLKFDKWEILGSVHLNNGYGSASFNLPDSSSNHVSVGFDTDNTALLGLGITVYDLELDAQVINFGVDIIATNDLFISFDYNGSEIQNLKWSGKITEIVDLILSVDFQTISLDLQGSWTLGVHGSFEFEINQDIIINLDQIDFGDIILNGTIGVYSGTTLKIDWIRGNTGHFQIQTDGVNFSPEFELIFYDKNSNEIFIYGNIILNPNCILKFDWEWGQTGHFTVFTNDLIENVNFEVGYNYDQSIDEYQYGFRISGVDVNLIRTIQWDTENNNMPRIWVLGDDPIPGDWDVWLLWQYEWYEVS